MQAKQPYKNGVNGMWARIAEILLGLWLIASYFLFSTNALIAAFFILLFATLSYIDKLNKMHLLQILPAAGLLYVGYTSNLQNEILVALSLLMFAIIPSNASDHPRPWKRFLQKEHK